MVHPVKIVNESPTTGIIITVGSDKIGVAIPPNAENEISAADGKGCDWLEVTTPASGIVWKGHVPCNTSFPIVINAEQPVATVSVGETLLPSLTTETSYKKYILIAGIILGILAGCIYLALGTSSRRKR